VRSRRLAALSFFVVSVPIFGASMASVSGIVVNDATNRPLQMAMVTLISRGPKPMEAAVYTNANGTFRFDNVPGGAYHLWAGEYGYQHVAFGAPTPDRYPAILTLGEGEVRQGIELRLRPLAAITGTVVDQNGDPVPGAMLQLMAPSWVRGRRSMVRRNGVTSNERGEFRIGGILPGRYYLSANAQYSPASEIRPEVSVGDQQPDLVMGRTWYPDAARMAGARPLEVRPGAEIGGIALQINTTAAAVVHGRIEAPDGINGGFQIHLIADDEGDGGVPETRSAFSPGGEFYLDRVPPGRYRVLVKPTENDEYQGMDEVDLQPGPQDLVLNVRKGARLAGHLELQGVPPGDSAHYTVTLIPGSSPTVSLRRLTATVEADGTFQFPAVAPGVWDIGVHPIPKGGFVKSMLLGSKDVLTEEMNITDDSSVPLSIVISGRGGVISGAVRMPQDPIADLAGRSSPVILLTPTGKLADVESFVMVKPAEEGGRYEIRGVTPGSYKVYAFDRMEQGAAHDRDFRARVDSLGKPVEIHEGEQVRLDLDELPFVSGEPQQ